MGKIPANNEPQESLKNDDKLYKWLHLGGWALAAYFILSYFLFFSERISMEALFSMLKVGSYVGMGIALVAVLTAIAIAHGKKSSVNT